MPRPKSTRRPAAQQLVKAADGVYQPATINVPTNGTTPRDMAQALLQAAIATGVRGELRSQLQAALEAAQRGPRKNLTDLEYASIPNGGHLVDPDRPGFIARKARGVLRYCYRYRDPETDKQDELVIGYAPATTLADARREWERLRADRLAGRTPIVAASEPVVVDTTPTISRLAEYYCRHYVDKTKRGRSASEDARLLNRHVLPQYGATKADAFTREVAQECLDQLADRPVEARKLKAVLSAMFNVCQGIVRKDRYTALPRPLPLAPMQNPMRGTNTAPVKSSVRAPELETMRDYYQALTSDDCPLRPEYRDALALQTLTACRINEIVNLQWAWVDLDAATLCIPAVAMKARDEHLVFLSAPALEILQRRFDERAAKDAYVFPMLTDRRRPLRVDLVQHALAANRAALKVDAAFTSHRVRAALATWAVEAEALPDAVNRVLAHRLEAKKGILGHYNAAAMDRQARVLWAAWAEALS